MWGLVRIARQHLSLNSFSMQKLFSCARPPGHFVTSSPMEVRELQRAEPNLKAVLLLQRENPLLLPLWQVLPLGTCKDLSLAFGWGNTSCCSLCHRLQEQNPSCFRCGRCCRWAPETTCRSPSAGATPSCRRGCAALRQCTTYCGASPTRSRGSSTAGASPSLQVRQPSVSYIICISQA